MHFNEHSNLEGQHAFLGASKNSWLNYNPDKLIETYKNHLANVYGTRLHALAKELILLKIKLPRSTKTLNSYVNDAIGYRMSPETILYYSDNCFGTADAISFYKDELRIHDLKTGVTPASMNQLLIYNALFCLEYDVDPKIISTELRIYQNDQVIVHNPDPEEVILIMDKIISFNKLIDKLKAEER